MTGFVASSMSGVGGGGGGDSAAAAALCSQTDRVTLGGPLDLVSLQWWISYLLDNYRREPGHVLIELACIAFIVYLIFRKPGRPAPTTEDRLSRSEEDELIAEWNPEPLAPAKKKQKLVAAAGQELPLQKEDAKDDLEHPTHLIAAAEDPYVLEGSGPWIQLQGVGRTFNLSSANYLGLSQRPEIKAACARTVVKYGVGSCGPRGFYGTIDVHLEAERTIAELLSTPESIIYSDGIATIASVIPAFSTRADILVVDEAVHWGIQQGITLSRSNVLYFRHNDMADLERVLLQLEEREKRRPKSGALVRKFIVVEGIYQNTGDLVPLDRVVELKKRFQFRVIVDDSAGFGVLGRTGRGVMEHHGLSMADVDIYAANLDGAIASVGGFCVGKSPEVVDHQRLSGLGYCFSASSPPYCNTAVVEGIRTMLREPELLEALRANARLLREQLAAADLEALQLELVGGVDVPSPLVHLRARTGGVAELDAAARRRFRGVQQRLLLEHRISVTAPAFIPKERVQPPASLRIQVTAAHDPEELREAVVTILDCLRESL